LVQHPLELLDKVTFESRMKVSTCQKQSLTRARNKSDFVQRLPGILRFPKLQYSSVEIAKTNTVVVMVFHPLCLCSPIMMLSSDSPTLQ
jgi:hypothetical protein